MKLVETTRKLPSWVIAVVGVLFFLISSVFFELKIQYTETEIRNVSDEMALLEYDIDRIVAEHRSAERLSDVGSLLFVHQGQTDPHMNEFSLWKAGENLELSISIVAMNTKSFDQSLSDKIGSFREMFKDGDIYERGQAYMSLINMFNLYEGKSVVALQESSKSLLDLKKKDLELQSQKNRLLRWQIFVYAISFVIILFKDLPIWKRQTMNSDSSRA